jgi:hypothetical protein
VIGSLSTVLVRSVLPTNQSGLPRKLATHSMVMGTMNAWTALALPVNMPIGWPYLTEGR